MLSVSEDLRAEHMLIGHLTQMFMQRHQQPFWSIFHKPVIMKQTGIHCSQRPIKGRSDRCRPEVIIFIKNYFSCSVLSEQKTPEANQN